MTGSLVPVSDEKPYDFDLFFGTEEDNVDKFMGFRGKDLKYTGVGTYKNDEAAEPIDFAFEGLVSLFELEVELVEAHEDVLIFNEKAVIPNGKEPRIEISDIRIEAEGDDIDAVDEAVKSLIKERAEKAIYD